MRRCVVLLLAGGCAAQHSRVLPGWDPVTVLLVLFAGLFSLRCPWPVLAIGAGAWLFSIAALDEAGSRLDPRYAGDSMLAIVRIIDFPVDRGETVSMLVSPLDDARIPRRLRVSWYRAPVRPALGDVWQLEVRLRRPAGMQNRGGFDVDAYMLREGLHASGYVVGGKRNRLLDANRAGLRERLRQRIDRRMAEVSPGAAAVLSALAVGARHRLDPDAWDRYAATGTSHLMAISGLHVGLAALTGFLLAYVSATLLRLPGAVLGIATVAGTCLAIGYAWLSGFGVPAQRAALMLLLFALAVLKRRYCDPFRVTLLAAAIVYVADPLSILRPGFHLSFAAVLLLLWLGRQLRRDAGWRAATCGLARLQGSLLLGLAPLTVAWFSRIAIYAPLANLVAVPVFSFVVVPAALLGVALLRSGRLADALFAVAGEAISGVEGIVALIASLPMAQHVVAGMHGAWTMVAPLPLLWVLLPRGWPGRGVAVLATLAILAYKPAAPPAGCFDAHVLDVGQGLSVVIETSRHTIVYDTGAAWQSGGTAAEQALLPFLDHRGIRRIDWLVVSHGDLDHAGGVAALASARRIDRTFVSERQQVHMPNAFRCRAGQRFASAGVVMRVLHPGPELAAGGNDGSCVVEVATGEHRLLLTGDIESAAENHLVDARRIRPSDVVVVPHHGSLTSSHPAFVNAADAKLAIVSAGRNNRWGFPKSAVRARWEGSGAMFFNTGTDGSVSMRLCARRGIVSIETQRQRRNRFWRDSSDP